MTNLLRLLQLPTELQRLVRDGVLSADELPGGKGPPITREQQRQTLIQRFHKQDANGDGYLSARELAAPPR